MTIFIIPLTIGFFLDLLFGDPEKLPHPVVAMGKFIEKTEVFLRKHVQNQVVGGGILVFLAVLTFTVLPFLVLVIAYGVSIYLGIFIESIMCWQCLAAKGLKKESMKVYVALKEKGIEEGRHMVSRIVGRDTDSLDEEGVIKATVETVAENTSDGVIAPMFYMALGGGVFGYFYKVVNTMDSMIGYKNDKYIEFGKCAAKLDDLVNIIPARVAGLLMTVSAFILGYDTKNSWKIFLRDRFNHASPNSAQTESACAGALGICLAGDAWYFGKLYKKKTIGDPLRPINIDDIVLANKLMYMTALIMLAMILILGFIGGVMSLLKG